MDGHNLEEKDMTGIRYFIGRKDADKYDVWLKEHQNDGIVINNFQNKDFKEIEEGKANIAEGKAAIHEASCPCMTRYDKYARITKYGKLCGLDESTLIKLCERTPGISPTRNCNQCFKSTV